MSAYFCGNPMNHEPHEKNGMMCEGVDRAEVKETIVEKFVPEMSEMAEDGTHYSKVTILIEDKKGNVTIINIPKASYIEFNPEYSEYINLEEPRLVPNPQIDNAELKFRLDTTDEAPAYKIERIKAIDNNR